MAEQLVRRLLQMKPRVLIVNDDEAITQQLFWTLCEEYDVVTANDLQTAVRRATVYVPDVALLDLQLEHATESPEMALRIIEYIKAHVPESKVLVMTSGTDPDVKHACATRGADEVLDKPFDTEVLLATMRRIAPRSLEGV
jgi:DNA-binding response OmpR family regulator